MGARTVPDERGSVEMGTWQIGDKVEAVMGYYKGSRGIITKIEQIQSRFQKKLGSTLIFVEFESHTHSFSTTPPKSAGFYGHEIVKIV